MEKDVAAELLEAVVHHLRKRSYSELRTWIGDAQCKEVTGPDGKPYQVEVTAFWDDPRTKEGNIRVIASIGDGTFLAALHPMTRDFIVAPDGSFVDESQDRGQASADR